MGRRRTALIAGLLVFAAALPAAAMAATTDPGALQLLGHTDLGGMGMNSNVAVVGNTAIVGAGYLGDTGFTTSQVTPGPCITPTAKVVDLTDPRHPKVASTIPIPPGVDAIDVDALQVKTPQFTGILAAIALDDGPSELGQQSCTPASANPSFTDRGVVYYDITKPSAPKFLGRYMADQGPQDDAAQNANPCGPPPDGSNIKCVTGQHSVALAQRSDGRVLSISVEPVADLQVKLSGDVRVVDVTDPTHPSQLGSWPALGDRPSAFSPNGCSPYVDGHDATLYDGGRRALVAFMDGGVFDLDLTDAKAPAKASQYSYPSDRTVQGDAGYVTAATVGGQTVALLSEESWYPTNTSLKIDAPASLAGSRFACEGVPTLFDPASQSQLYKRPGSAVTADIVYGGRGCAARGTAASPTPEDPYPSDPRGKIVMLDTVKVSATQPDIATQACNNTTRIMRAQAAGAVAVMFGRVQLPPLSASPDAVAWGGDPKGLTIPGVMIDEPDANTLRAALCPSLVNGQCATGAAVHGSLVDGPGQWGGLRVLDVDPDTGMTQVALLHSPHGTTFPPPDQGVYAPGPSVVAGKLAYVTWHADGLRVIDLSQQPPREVAHFVPPDTPDPTNTLPAKASVVGVAVSANLVVISDTNSGLYVLDRGASGGGSSLGIYLLIGLGVVTAVLTTSLVVRRRRV